MQMLMDASALGGQIYTMWSGVVTPDADGLIQVDSMDGPTLVMAGCMYVMASPQDQLKMMEKRAQDREKLREAAAKEEEARLERLAKAEAAAAAAAGHDQSQHPAQRAPEARRDAPERK